MALEQASPLVPAPRDESTNHGRYDNFRYYHRDFFFFFFCNFFFWGGGRGHKIYFLHTTCTPSMHRQPSTGMKDTRIGISGWRESKRNHYQAKK